MKAVSPFQDYAFVSIGSNLPFALRTPLDIIAFALAELEQLSPRPILSSSIYVTSPVDSPEGTPDFYNAVAGIMPLENDTSISLLHKLQAIETLSGRQRSGTRNEARTLDLDLLTFKDEIIESVELTLPHPGANERRFVLQPLMEIAGKEFRLPGFRQTLEELLETVSRKQQISKL